VNGIALGQLARSLKLKTSQDAKSATYEILNCALGRT
jgi:hypothetical protein